MTALRAFGPNKQKQPTVIGCSIDPTQEGLKKMQEFLRSVGMLAAWTDEHREATVLCGHDPWNAGDLERSWG